MKRYNKKVFGINVYFEISRDLLKNLPYEGLHPPKDRIQEYLNFQIMRLDWNPEFSLETTDSMAILKAHGIRNMPGWNYEEIGIVGSSKIRSVQKWIDKHDGVDVLFIHSCNPENGHGIKSSESVLIYPKEDIHSDQGLEMYNPDFLVRYDPKEDVT